MIAQNRFLKNILTTASTLAIIAGAASEVGATPVAQLSTSNSHTGGQSWGGGSNTNTFTSGNSVLLDAATNNIGINTGSVR